METEQPQLNSEPLNIDAPLAEDESHPLEMTDEEEKILQRIRGNYWLGDRAVLFTPNHRRFGEQSASDKLLEKITTENGQMGQDWSSLSSSLLNLGMEEQIVAQVFTLPFDYLRELRANLVLSFQMDLMAIDNPGMIPIYRPNFKRAKTAKEGVVEVMRLLKEIEDEEVVRAGQIKVLNKIIELRFGIQTEKFDEDLSGRENVEEIDYLNKVDIEQHFALLLEKKESEAQRLKKEVLASILDPDEGQLENANFLYEPRKILGGMNEVYTSKIDGIGTVIIKPKRGENNKAYARDVPPGTFYKRERAAYLVDRFLKLNIVPTTVIREDVSDIGISSLQRWVEGDELGHGDSRENIRPFQTKYEQNFESFIKLLILDYAIWNCDRHVGNIRIGDELHAIDNGTSFTRSKDQSGEESAKHFHINFDQDGFRVDPEVAANIMTFAESQSHKQVLKILLLELLPENEVKAFFSRIQHLADQFKEGLKFHSSWFDMFPYNKKV